MRLSVELLPLPSDSCSAQFRSNASKLLACLQGITCLWACVEAKQVQLLDLLLLSGADTAEGATHVRLHYLDAPAHIRTHLMPCCLLVHTPLVAYACGCM